MLHNLGAGDANDLAGPDSSHSSLSQGEPLGPRIFLSLVVERVQEVTVRVDHADASTAGAGVPRAAP